MPMRYALLIFATLLSTTSLARAQQPRASEPVAATGALEGLLIATLKQEIPRQYTDDSKWGRTKYQTVGVKVERDGLKLEVRRRKKQINDGLWKLYRIDLPDAEQWEISFSEFRDLGDGRVGFEATFATPLKVLARAANWEHGVQLISISAQADARVRLTVGGEMRLKLIASQLPPAVRLEPKVTSAALKIEQFRLNRISQLHGPLVRELGEEAHDFLQREVDKRREKLVEKANKQIEKHADELTLSWAELANAKWNPLNRRPSAEAAEATPASAPAADSLLLTPPLQSATDVSAGS